jgi:hypothetical protein
MCIFTAPVQGVHETRIFARLNGSRQALVYSMRVSARDELAMVLPIPVALGSGEVDFEFVDLSGCADLFEQLEELFVRPAPAGAVSMAWSEPAAIPVHEVGAYEASFVPSVADFARLDPRFRLSESVFAGLPQYADWGFAVFKLKPGEAKRYHPMAFWFPTREAEALFFPTVHVHDGQVHGETEFDHTLYLQLPADKSPAQVGLNPLSSMTREEWRRSFKPVRPTLEYESKGILREALCYRLQLNSQWTVRMFPNQDLILPLASR